MEKGEALVVTRELVEQEFAELEEMRQQLAARRLAFYRLQDYLVTVGRSDWLPPRPALPKRLRS